MTLKIVPSIKQLETFKLEVYCLRSKDINCLNYAS